MDRLEGEAGLVASLRALAATLLGLAGTRAELAVLELREEAERRERRLALVGLAALFLVPGLLLVALVVVLAFWDTHRVAAAAVMGGIYLAIAAGLVGKARAERRDAPPPFEATLRELALDRQALGGGQADE